MARTFSGRLSAKQTGWLVVLLLAGWLLFLVLPFGKTDREEATEIAELRPGEAELTTAGLPYNVDWIGLPTFFPIWADQFVWRGDKVEFAYWNPSTETYSYFFEAVRKGKNYRFRLLGKNEIPYEDRPSTAADKLKATEMHPFQQIYFGTAKTVRLAPEASIGSNLRTEGPDFARLDIKLERARLEAPKPELLQEATDGKEQ